MQTGEHSELHPEFIENEAGERTGVVLSMAEWEAIQRILKPEPASDDVLESLKAQGLSLDDLKVCR